MQSHYIVNQQTLPVESRRALRFDNFPIQSATYCSRNDCKIVAYRWCSGRWLPISTVQNVRRIALIAVLDGRYLVMISATKSRYVSPVGEGFKFLLAGFYGHNKSASDLPQTLRAMCIAYLIGPPSLHLFTQSKTHHRITLRVLRNEILAAIKAKKPCVSKKQVQISWLEYDVNVNREICPEYV